MDAPAPILHHWEANRDLLGYKWVVSPKPVLQLFSIASIMRQTLQATQHRPPCVQPFGIQRVLEVMLLGSLCSVLHGGT